MTREPIEFGPFRLDTEPDRLWRGSEEVHLRAKSLSVLAYLARRLGRLVTKDELREQVWGAAHVNDTTLRVAVFEIRAALEDDTPGSSYLETVPGRGYRFHTRPEVSSGLDSAATQREDRPPVGQDEPIVGRRREIEYMMNRFLEADKGRRQLVFVAGEPGPSGDPPRRTCRTSRVGRGGEVCHHSGALGLRGQSSDRADTKGEMMMRTRTFYRTFVG